MSSLSWNFRLMVLFLWRWEEIRTRPHSLQLASKNCIKKWICKKTLSATCLWIPRQLNMHTSLEVRQTVGKNLITYQRISVKGNGTSEIKIINTEEARGVYEKRKKRKGIFLLLLCGVFFFFYLRQIFAMCFQLYSFCRAFICIVYFLKKVSLPICMKTSRMLVIYK